MAKFEKRQEAHMLRRKGWSINVIAQHLGVSKGSVSVWCRDINLTDKQKERLIQNSIKAGHKGRMIGAEMNHNKKIERIEMFKKIAKKDLGKISKRDLLVFGTALYWGEGSKTGGRFIFVNSDPDMIRIMYKFIREILNVPKDRIKLTVQINKVHELRIKEVLNFWSSLLHLSLSQFTKSYFIKTKPKKVYKNHDSYYGVLRLGVAKSSDLQYKILGLINVFKQ